MDKVITANLTNIYRDSIMNHFLLSKENLELNLFIKLMRKEVII